MKFLNIKLGDIFGSFFRTIGAAVIGGIIGGIVIQKSIEYGIPLDTLEDVFRLVTDAITTEYGAESLIALIAIKVGSLINKHNKNNVAEGKDPITVAGTSKAAASKVKKTVSKVIKKGNDYDNLNP